MSVADDGFEARERIRGRTGFRERERESEGRVRCQLESGRLGRRSAERKNLQWMNSRLGEFAIG